MTDYQLTEKEAKVLMDLRSIDAEDTFDDPNPGFKMVYLDNGIDTSDKTVKGVLGSLEKKGLYIPEDSYAWGWVKK